MIVSPSSISFQWIEEIQKHIKHKDIKMLFYKGSKETGYIQPRTLGNHFDLVKPLIKLSISTFSFLTNYNFLLFNFIMFREL